MASASTLRLWAARWRAWASRASRTARPTSCGLWPGAPRAPRFLAYDGPPVTQIVVNKSDRMLFLVSGKTVLKSYKVSLGNQPVGAKQFEGDGKTPEGIYFIDRFNPRSA